MNLEFCGNLSEQVDFPDSISFRARHEAALRWSRSWSWSRFVSRFIRTMRQSALRSPCHHVFIFIKSSSFFRTMPNNVTAGYFCCTTPPHCRDYTFMLYTLLPPLQPPAQRLFNYLRSLGLGNFVWDLALYRFVD